MELNQENENWIETSSGRIRLTEDGIIHVVITTRREQTPADAKENLTTARQFCHTVKRRILLDLRGVKRPNKETQQVYADKELTDFALAMAMIIETDYISQVMANFFLKFSNQPYPMKLFFDTKHGLQWLNNYKYH